MLLQPVDSEFLEKNSLWMQKITEAEKDHHEPKKPSKSEGTKCAKQNPAQEIPLAENDRKIEEC